MATTKISGAKELSFMMAASETVEIEYGYNPLVNIANLTAGDIYVNGTGVFTGGKYITLRPEAAYDRYRAVNGSSNEPATIYIRAVGSGIVTIAVAVY